MPSGFCLHALRLESATAHGQTKLGSTTQIRINGVLEVLHTSCSCRATPETNLQVCNPVCLDSSSPDNSTGAKGPGSPLWTLVAEKNPSLGTQTCGSTGTGQCVSELPAPPPQCTGKKPKDCKKDEASKP